jgi:hypothetical protein
MLDADDLKRLAYEDAHQAEAAYCA